LQLADIRPYLVLAFHSLDERGQFTPSAIAIPSFEILSLRMKRLRP